ncbi:probable multidrug resistance-associated protein lethal(2)03659 [Cylas formicarius]|uniref:probable multidrug resistance-associated protein lethal(2)03659 n=1 Tax=Cylas formicarius TaxID=197179 RepID=UPI0029586281|nr:probable multidrug resistance-associated protein lethal(2)03659 [Cylas formicarius]XP_060521460.1 probable multidrug resistance-associated protein lethal(2)03659 [Cylas formicarius]
MDHYGIITRKQNPKDRANIFSLLTFTYTFGLFKKAFKRDLVEDDIYEVIESCKAKKNGDRFEKKWKRQKNRTNPSLARLMWQCFGIRYVVLGIIRVSAKIFVSVVEPEAIGKLVSYFNPTQATLTFHDALYYAALMIGAKLLNVFSLQNYILFLQQLAIQIRTCLCSMVYRKALKLTPTAMNEISLGNIITVITKDVLVFEQAIYMFNDMWMELIRMTVVSYLIYNKMGVSCFIGVGVLLLVIPIQIYIGKRIKNLRLELAHKTDQRLQATQEALSAIKIIKMYTWEKIFAKKVEEKRTKEMKYLMKCFYLRALNFIVGAFNTKIGFYCLIMAYIYFNKVADAEVMFYVLKCFKDLKMSVAFIIPAGLGRGAELIASANRINKVFSSEELEETDDTNHEHAIIKLSNVNVTIKQNEILRNISFELKPGLTVITGPLGCGKSALLKLFLKDYHVTSGKIYTQGRFSYCSQDPWLFPSSIKQNILFGQPYEEKRYDEVIKVCALQYDLNLFDKGDETIVSDRGMNLSGGQQARVNLARAVYRKSNVYLLDDPLHALDPNVQDYIYQNCIRGFLKNEYCVMVTHNLKHKSHADRLVVLNEGRIVFEGNPQNVDGELLKGVELQADKVEENEKGNEGNDDDETATLIKRTLTKKKVYGESKKEGKVEMEVYKNYFKFGGGLLFFSVIVGLYVCAEFTDSYSTRVLTDWINVQQNVTNILTNPIERATRGATNTTTENGNAYPEILNLVSTEKAKDIDNEIYPKVAFENIVLVQLYDQAHWLLKLYTLMIVASVFLDLIKQLLFVNFSRKASINLHNTMIEKLVTAAMSFFDTYFIGNILNRFSQDLTTVDEHLPLSINMVIECVLAAGGVGILVATVSWQFLIPSVILLLCLVGLRFIYIPTSRSLKRLESATRSPLIGHLNASMEGVTTIRACKAEKILEEEFDRHQDLYTSAHFMTFSIRRAFSFAMDMLSVFFVAVIVAKFLFFDLETSSGDVGLAITKAASLANIIQWVLMVWSDVENNMTSVERVLEYTEVGQDLYEGRRIDNWPTKGKIVYENVSLAYKDEKVLKNLSFEVESKQKIGIVGRTGAGKSSIISTMFRLYNFDGRIFIDGVDTKTLSLDLLRDKISIIPQEPLLFQGTIRENIDPLGRYSDAEVWQTLDQVHMKEHIDTLELAITDHGSNFSTGQRQLICLARATIKKNKIVVLDEATSNMDPETEFLVQKVVREQFADYTVFIIAHRLQSVLDCNQIIVMEKGRIVEMDEPLRLLNDKRSFFTKMLQVDNAHLFDK